jgi:hypothetical protein
MTKAFLKDCSLLIAFTLPLSVSALAQTATWSGGAGNWSDCPPSGNALWDSCGDIPPQFPNGPTWSAVIQGGPVTATSASIVNLTIGTGGSLIFAAPPNSGLLFITGTSIVNNGSINIASSNGLAIDGNTTAVLSGSGSVTIAGSHFTGRDGNPTLINQQPVQGQGTFGLGLNLTNQSVVKAIGGTLSVQPTSAINTGTMQASSGSTLAFTNGTATAYNNTGGTIKAFTGGIVQLYDGIYTGGTLTTAGTGVIQAYNSAVLNNLTNSGTLQVNYASLENTITNTGTISVLPSGTLFMTGQVTLSGSGVLLMSGSGSLHQAGGSDSLTNNQRIHGSGTIYELPLTNQATISANISGKTLFLSGGATTNKATLQATGGGILELDTVVNNKGGTIQALNGSTVLLTNSFNGSVNGGTLTTSGSGTIQSQNGVLDGTVNMPTNAGLLEVNSFDLFLQGTVRNTGTIALTGNGCIILNKPSTLSGPGTVTMASTTCIFGAGSAFTNQNTIEGSGSIGDSNPMPITNNGTIWATQASPLLIVPDASGFTNNGKLIVNAGSTLTIKNLFNNLSNTGTLTSGTYSVTGTLGFPNSVLTNDANIALTGAAAEILNGSSTNALATMTGNGATGVLSLASGQILTTSGNLSNAGKVTVGMGSSLNPKGSYTQTAGQTTVDGTLSAPTGLVLSGGTLLGRGTLAAVVNSSSVVVAGDATTKAGKLTITGSYTQNAIGVLDISIGGITAGSQYSQVAVSNRASLNGTLNIKLINGFVPAIGATFTILPAGMRTGTFSTVNGTSINSTEHFVVDYTPTAVTLKVVSGA